MSFVIKIPSNKLPQSTQQLLDREDYFAGYFPEAGIFDPAARRMAVFYNSADLLGRDVLILAMFSLIALFLGSMAISRQTKS